MTTMSNSPNHYPRVARMLERDEEGRPVISEVELHAAPPNSMEGFIKAVWSVHWPTRNYLEQLVKAEELEMPEREIVRTAEIFARDALNAALGPSEFRNAHASRHVPAASQAALKRAEAQWP